ncbi:MAG TPA: ABC transporter ATP-binding protein [Dinghuibacter sp.]|jgi:lipoprotein-releasing system ATP-binding protein|uniref:ABC transporter ATP-binding protein n=1 Tax=Dinghuibacter sp. TaxID=2024697 RepID=UPI002CE55864|nr:ABC transporter ATP-binding protein [Dinghuibacter sp.]HTJ13548.1 ABC transporter ATP-binding protein [Dinghuibacter sp.]
MLSARGIVKSFGNLTVLKGVDLEVRTGEIVSIVGSSGAGKSTLLHILGTLDLPDRGEIRFGGVDGKQFSGSPVQVDQLRPKALAHFRNERIGFVFQFHHLLPEFSALENVCIPGWLAGKKKKAVEQRALELLDILGLADRADNKPHTLSGGEAQRVAVARALINQPSVVFADEPTGNLDSTHARELHNLFLQLRDRFQQTFVIVTHNEELARMSDRTVHMKDGLVL